LTNCIIRAILFLWLVCPTRENTPPKAFDLFEAGIHDEQHGRKNDAVKKYEKAVDIFPEFEAAWLNLGMVHQDMENLPLSISTAERALEHLPTSTVLWGSLGSFYDLVGIVHKAEAAFRKAVDCNSQNSLAMSHLGLLLARTGRLEEAERILSKSREVNPERIGEPKEWDSRIRMVLSQIRSDLSIVSKIGSPAEATLRSAKMLVQGGKLEEAEGFIKQAIDKNPDVAGFWHFLGHLYFQMGRRSEEKDAFRRVLEIDENHEVARVDLADTLIEDGLFREAEELLRPAISRNPKNHFAWMNLGKALLAQGSDGEGEQALKNVVELKPDYVNAYFQLGKLYQRRGNLQQAESAFRKTVQYKPDHAGGWIELGVVLMNNDRLEEAEDAWRTAIKHDPRNDAPWVNLSSIMSTSGRCDEAKDALKRAQELAPNDEFVIRAEMLWKTFCGGGASRDFTHESLVMDDSDNLEYAKTINDGLVLFDNGQVQEAQLCYRRAIDLDKTKSIGWGMLGTVLSEQGLLDEAEQAFKEALKLSKPVHPVVMSNYSILLKQLGREDEAEKVLRQLTKQHPDFANGWFNLGNLYLKRKEWKHAEQMYRTALDKKPEPNLMIRVKWNRGTALKELNKFEQAERSLLEALELDPTNESIRKILEQVRVHK
jgi:tetratricopeptide (TPR) repeat protein